MLPKHIKQVQRRSRHLHARKVGLSIMVDSATEVPGRYVVTIRYNPTSDTITAYCSCNWGNHHGVACSHVMAALEMMAAQKGRSLSYWLTEDEARRQRHKRFYLTRGDDAEGVWITSRPTPRANVKPQRIAA